MKKNGKTNIRSLVNLKEKDGLEKSLEKLNKRLNYLKKKRPKFSEPSNQMKYITFHIKKLKKLQAGGNA